jgi:L-fuculose-phosphate aldolase
VIQKAVQGAFALLFGQAFADAGFHFFERGGMGRFAADHTRDVKTEGGTEDRADLAGGQVEDHFVELVHHLAAREPAEVAVSVRAVGVPAGEFFERRAGLEFGFNRLDSFEGGRGVAVLGRVFHDVRGVYEFRDFELFAMGAVVGDDVLVPDVADASGVAGDEAVDTKIQLRFRGEHTGPATAFPGRRVAVSGERRFDFVGRDRFAVGKRGLAKQHALDYVVARPVPEALLQFLASRIAHGGGKMRAKPTRFFFHQSVVQQFAIDTYRHGFRHHDTTAGAIGRPGIEGARTLRRRTRYPQIMGSSASVDAIVREIVSRYQEEIDRLRALPSAPPERLFHSRAALALKEEILAVGKKLWLREFVDGNGGNISCRLTDDLVLCTPTLRSKYDLRVEDISLVDLNNQRVCGAVPHTSEILLHLTIYKHNRDARAVVHCHPPHATAFSITGTVPPQGVLPEYEVFVGVAPVSPYDTPGTQAFADTVIPYVAEHNTILLANHGIVCWADTVTHAEWQAEVLDTYCRTIMLAAQLGRPLTHIPDAKVGDLVRLKKKLNLPDPRHEKSLNGATAPNGKPSPAPTLDGVAEERINLLSKRIAAELAARLNGH